MILYSILSLLYSANFDFVTITRCLRSHVQPLRLYTIIRALKVLSVAFEHNHLHTTFPCAYSFSFGPISLFLYQKSIVSILFYAVTGYKGQVVVNTAAAGSVCIVRRQTPIRGMRVSYIFIIFLGCYDDPCVT